MQQEHLVPPISLSLNCRGHMPPKSILFNVGHRAEIRLSYVSFLFFVIKMFHFSFLSTPDTSGVERKTSVRRHQSVSSELSLMCLLFCELTQVRSRTARVRMFSRTNSGNRHSLRILSHADDIYTLTRSRPEEFKTPH